MSHPQFILLVNPFTGRGRALRAGEIAARRLRERGIDCVSVVGQTAVDAADRLDAAVADNPDAVAIIACGGDGTVHQALQRCVTHGLALGIVPAGTGNDAARMLALPGDPAEAADVIADACAGEPWSIDVGWVEAAQESANPEPVVRRHFVAVVSSGFDSMVNERANDLRWPRGQARYLRAIVAELRVFRAIAYQVELDAGLPSARTITEEGMLVAVGNGPSYGGGMRVCPAASPTNRHLDVTFLRKMPTARFLRVFPTVYRGTHVHRPEVDTYLATTVSLEATGQIAYADGERVGPLPVKVGLDAASLRVLAVRPPTLRG